MYFPLSGVSVNPCIPLVVTFVVSFFTSMSGVSGAFLLLPFQVSVLGFTSPAVSPTNLVYNIVAIPSGIYRYMKEQRMAWPLAFITIAGTLPGMFIGALVRINYFLDPKSFKFFVGWVLLYIGVRLLYDLIRGNQTKAQDIETAFSEMAKQKKVPPSEASEARVKTLTLSFTQYTYSFYGESFSLNPLVLFLLTLIVGVIGGIYGIGGGAIIAPFLIAIFHLPVYTVAGAALLGTFVTSVGGIIFYSLIALNYAHTGVAIAPDWMLGGLFGIGGFLGIYCGARLQKYIPAKIIKLILGIIIILVSLEYITGMF